MRNAVESTPLGVAYADPRIPISHYPKEDFWEEILKRRIAYATIALFSIIFVLGIVGNGWVIFILGFVMKKTSRIVWLLNLTASNFLFVCSLPLRITHNAMMLNWPFGRAICKLNDSIVFLNLYASAYFLAVLSLERWASMKSSTWAQHPRKIRLTWIVAGGIWLLALGFSSARIHIRHTSRSPVDEDVIVCFLNYGRNLRQAKINQHLILISQYVCAFLVPIVMTIVSLAKTHQRQGVAMRWAKSFKMITTMIVTFYLCWLPYAVFSFFESEYLETSPVLIVGIPLATSLAFASSCVNPILYIALGYNFKERPRPSLLSAFENVFGEESNGTVPETQPKPAAEMSPQNL
ncbi:chemerin-like receptor 1 [Heteronotia binoei]|uniref:chemerin-like receptor 1 n=1 Tax=Heteronotia binoei TaxID=13085 RepID=UPI00292E417B|nr:chemerin-like receptor 1 [Heteronotia binoei]